MKIPGKGSTKAKRAKLRHQVKLRVHFVGILVTMAYALAIIAAAALIVAVSSLVTGLVAR